MTPKFIMFILKLATTDTAPRKTDTSQETLM